MVRRFSRHAAALDASRVIARRCGFSFDELSYQYPREVAAQGESAQQTLERLTWAGAALSGRGGATGAAHP